MTPVGQLKSHWIEIAPIVKAANTAIEKSDIFLRIRTTITRRVDQTGAMSKWNSSAVFQMACALTVLTKEIIYMNIAVMKPIATQRKASDCHQIFNATLSTIRNGAKYNIKYVRLHYLINARSRHSGLCGNTFTNLYDA